MNSKFVLRRLSRYGQNKCKIEMQMRRCRVFSFKNNRRTRFQSQPMFVILFVEEWMLAGV